MAVGNTNDGESFPAKPVKDVSVYRDSKPEGGDRGSHLIWNSQTRYDGLVSKRIQPRKSITLTCP